MPLVRHAVGPLLVGAAAWCAAGRITVISADAASERLAVFAPWWVFAVAVAVASAVPAWRRRPVLAAPALLSTLPWWPAPLGAALLVWTGPAAWVPIGIALALAAAEDGAAARASRALTAIPPRRAAVLAAAMTLVASAATAWSLAPRLPGGDEPHYLVITQSLLADGDLQIENNHRQRDYAAYFGGTIAPDYIERGKNLEIYSIHAPGVSALVLPAFAVAGYRGAQATVVLLAAAGAALVWLLAWRASGRDSGAAWFAWAAVALVPTALIQNVTIFPDGPGAVAAAAGAWLIVRLHEAGDRPSPATIAVVSAALAALPWLHTRFALLAGGLGVAIMATLLRQRADRDFPRRLVAFAAVPTLSALAWFAFFQIVYGTPDPRAPYGQDKSSSIWYVPGGLMGLLFDQQFGLITHAPVLLAASTAVFARGSMRTAVRWLVGVVAVYLMVVCVYWMWWAGVPAPPARFAAAALPLLAAPLAIAWRHAGEGARAIWLTLLAVSAVLTTAVLGVDRGVLAWNPRDAEARWLEWLSPVVNLPRAWPSFFWALDPNRLATEWPFVAHVAVWLSVFVVFGWMLIARSGAVTPQSRRLRVALWLVVGVTVAATVGWRVSGGSSLDPARSQWAMVRAASAGAAIRAIRPGSIRQVTNLSGLLAIPTEEPGRTDAPPPWLDVADVPAGDYAVEIEVARPSRGEVAVRAGSPLAPLRQWSLQPLTRQSFTLSLPAPIERLQLAPDPALAGVAATVIVRPIVIAGSR
ncbi:MAG TPA: hypothetical protein VFO19_22950 [Vicinamibacterales bacterium]|nr:hypothetical protein [Vicinamibacterales bacterium]